MLIGVVCAASFEGNTKRSNAFTFSLIGLFLSIVMVALRMPQASTLIFSGTLVVNKLTQLFKLILLVSAMMFIVLGYNSNEICLKSRLEYVALTLILAVSGCVAVSSVHLLPLFMSIEGASLSILFLVAMGLHSGRSSDAAIRILFYGFLPVLMTVTGILLIYLITGTMSFDKIKAFLESGPNQSPLLIVALALISLSLLSRLAQFPFHALVAPVVAASPVPSVAQMVLFFSVVTFAAFLKIFYNLFSGYDAGRLLPLVGLDWKWVLAVVGAITMSVVNLMALKEENLKKIIAFSVVFNNALVLSALAMRDIAAISAMVTTIVIHTLAALGLFFVAMPCIDSGGDSSTWSVKGLVWRNPLEGSAAVVFILSLAALPPFAGFPSRVYTVSAMLSAGAVWLAVLAIGNFLLAAVYYARLLRLVFESVPGSAVSELPPVHFSVSSKTAIVLLMLPSVFFGVYWEGLVEFISDSITTIIW
jgi:NADH-quinone oxidoreductase subunit N